MKSNKLLRNSAAGGRIEGLPSFEDKFVEAFFLHGSCQNNLIYRFQTVLVQQFLGLEHPGPLDRVVLKVFRHA